MDSLDFQLVASQFSMMEMNAITVLRLLLPGNEKGKTKILTSTGTHKSSLCRK
jgi:hypothetical protein